MIPLSLRLHKDMRWSSDWNGYEVGFPEYDAVGLYHCPIDFYQDEDEGEAELSVYIDCETGVILQMWVSKEGDF